MKRNRRRPPGSLDWLQFAYAIGVPLVIILLALAGPGNAQEAVTMVPFVP